jgi:hypothetical protein
MCEESAVTIRSWIAGTLAGHLVAGAIIFSLPYLIWFLVSNFGDGTLTAPTLIRLVVIDFTIGGITSAAVWYLVTLPIIKKNTPPNK